MNYTEQRKAILKFCNDNSVSTLKKFEKISTLKSLFERLEKIKGVSVDYLYSDIIKKRIDIKLKEFISKEYYDSSNLYAFNCLEIELDCRKIPVRLVENWLQNALKCFDYLLIFIITEILKEKIKQKNNDKSYEQDVYQFLIEKDGILNKVGSNFRKIYNIRSSFVHIQYRDENGLRQIRKLTYKTIKRKKDKAINYFYFALTYLLLYFKSINIGVNSYN